MSLERGTAPSSSMIFDCSDRYISVRYFPCLTAGTSWWFSSSEDHDSVPSAIFAYCRKVSHWNDEGLIDQSRPTIKR